jgi:hypothetical protein
MDWISDFGRRFWQAYQEGLVMSCPVHRAAADRAAEKPRATSVCTSMTSPKRSQGSKPSATEQTDGPTDLIVTCADEGSESRAVRRGRPSAAEAEQIVGRILEASWDVLLAEGFEGFTFDRVARHAHIGKATIYSRFANKRELMGALCAIASKPSTPISRLWARVFRRWRRSSRAAPKYYRCCFPPMAFCKNA